MDQSNRDSDAPELLIGLRRALAGAQQLQGEADTAIFPRGKKGKALSRQAVERGWLATSVERRQGPKRTVAVELGKLTEAGLRYIEEADSPKAVLEALSPAVQELVRAHHEQASLLQSELARASEMCVASIREAFAHMERTILSAVASQTRPAVDGATLLAAVSRVVERLASQRDRATESELRAAEETAATPRPPSSAGRNRAGVLRAALRESYDELCLYEEFRDGFVEIPRLYHEARTRIPDLTVRQFHAAIEALSRDGTVELHKLNEVAKAKEPELAISTNDRLYYFIVWSARP